MTEPKRKTTDPKFIPSVFALTMGLFISTGILLFPKLLFKQRSQIKSLRSTYKASC